jgi:hypothetical protein
LLAESDVCHGGKDRPSTRPARGRVAPHHGGHADTTSERFFIESTTERSSAARADADALDVHFARCPKPCGLHTVPASVNIEYVLIAPGLDPATSTSPQMNVLSHKGLHDIGNERWNAYGQFTYISSWKRPTAPR